MRGAVVDMAGRTGESTVLDGCGESRLQGGMFGLYQKNLDRHATVESEKEDGGARKEQPVKVGSASATQGRSNAGIAQHEEKKQ